MTIHRFALAAFAFSSILAFDAHAAAGDEYVYLLTRASTPILRTYRLDVAGELEMLQSKPLQSITPEGWTSERRVLSFAKRERILVAGLPKHLVTFKVAANGEVGDPLYLSFPGVRIDCVEVVERGERTFVYAGSDDPNRIHGYELAKSGALTPVPGSPFPSNTNAVDLLQVDQYLHAVEFDNTFVSTYQIAADGALLAPKSPDEHDRPEERGWQLEVAPDKTTLFTNGYQLGYAQAIQRAPGGAVYFSSLAATLRSNTPDSTIIAMGKKLFAVASADDVDGSANVRFYKVGANGSLRCCAPDPDNTGTKGMKFIDFAQNDRFLLVASEMDATLRVLPVDKKLGATEPYSVDSESLSGLTQLATMLIVE